MRSKTAEVEADTDFDVLLREVVAVDQDLADLVFGLRVFTFVGVAILEKKLAVTVLNDWLRVVLDLIYNPKNFGDLHIYRRLGKGRLDLLQMQN